ncbi:putative disease resistance protein [Prunus yedoensis var. nudiflora]|uniref:Putative disease resistance protein n=1 Tax=Prunus yedoensis var. nudiflora TaxID=2094558 RepID=A0A314YKF7_PRUYE|nr:putative disease resistance protein [Prunus yedoensis var. nudiflora]
MLQNCKGLPLAITVLAGLLAIKDTVEEWNTVHKNVYEYIRRGTDLGPDYKGEAYEGVSWLLELSYDNLPYYLELCFLYLTHFPEDYEIPVSTLTKLWMAEGFISSASAEVMEDVSYRCLSELVGRCMVQVGKHGSSQKIKTCHLHDLMRDLCMLKAKEGNFVHIINYSVVAKIKETPNGRVRRLAIYLDKTLGKYALGKDENYGHVRSLLYFFPGKYFKNSKVLWSLFKNFTLLRVLKFEGMYVGECKLHHEIGNLVHLRFLSVKNSAILAVPSSIANLVCLQTLDLRVRYLGIEIPNGNVFSKMEKLRHIYLPKYHSARKKHLLFATEAVNLHTVVNVCIQASDLDDFVKLTNLRKLGVITFDSGLWEKEKGTNIIFKHLQSLSVDSVSEAVPWNIVLSCPNIYKLRLDGRITELPENLLCLTNLTKLTLKGINNLKDDHIKVLEKLPSLRMLFLDNWDTPVTFRGPLVCSKGGFPFLEFLSLRYFKELKEWKVEKGAMPSLCRLHIHYCSALKAVPDGLQYITTLKELTIKSMPSKFCRQLQEGGEDFYKIQHVQSVII